MRYYQEQINLQREIRERQNFEQREYEQAANKHSNDMWQNVCENSETNNYYRKQMAKQIQYENKLLSEDRRNKEFKNKIDNQNSNQDQFFDDNKRF